jgi:hypothetical protein
MTVSTLLARQAGVITRQQALAAGFTRHAVDHACACATGGPCTRRCTW